MKLEQGQVAVVTGAASGIGQALAEALVRRHVSVVLADVEAEPLERTAQALQRAGGAEVMVRRVDVGDAGAMDTMARRVFERFGRVDLLCNVAGVVGPRLPTWEQRPEDWQWVLQVNLTGVANALRAFMPYLVAHNHGHVVNVASIAGLATIRGGGNAPYAASKHAVVGLSETLREELDHVAPDVGVTIVCPGPVATGIREAERNRPATLRLDDAARLPGANPPTFVHTAPTISAEDVARQIIEAVEANRLYLLTNPGTAVDAHARVDRLLAALPAD